VLEHVSSLVLILETYIWKIKLGVLIKYMEILEDTFEEVCQKLLS